MNNSMIVNVIAGTSLFGLLGGLMAAVGTTSTLMNNDLRIEPLYTHLEAYSQSLPRHYAAVAAVFAEAQPAVMKEFEHALSQLFGLSRSMQEIMKKHVLNWHVVACNYRDTVTKCVRLLEKQLDTLTLTNQERDALFADLTALDTAAATVCSNVNYAVVNGS
jgi:hypothetical protein